MRNVTIAVLFGLFIVCANTAFASGDWDPCDSKLKSIVNECAGHPTEKNKMEAGLGVDVPLYKSDSLHVDQETKIDLNAGDFGDFKKGNIGTYTVFKPQLEEGILQTAWKKLAGLFGGGE